MTSDAEYRKVCANLFGSLPYLFTSRTIVLTIAISTNKCSETTFYAFSSLKELLKCSHCAHISLWKYRERKQKVLSQLLVHKDFFHQIQTLDSIHGPLIQSYLYVSPISSWSQKLFKKSCATRRQH